MRLTRSLLAVLAACLLLVPLAACGGDDGGSPLTAGNDDTTDDTASDDTDDTTSDDADDATSDDTDDSTGDDEIGDFCLNDEFMAAAAGIGMSGDGDNPEDVAKFFDEMADEVPDEIADDFRVFADGIGPYLSALAEFEGEDASMFSDPEVMETLEKMSTPEFEEASTNITEWMEANC